MAHTVTANGGLVLLSGDWMTNGYVDDSRTDRMRCWAQDGRLYWANQFDSGPDGPALTLDADGCLASNGIGVFQPDGDQIARLRKLDLGAAEAPVGEAVR